VSGKKRHARWFGVGKADAPLPFAIENAGDPTAEIINYLEEQRLLADYYHRRQERRDYYQNRLARE
jgi:hypothetical protein